MNTVTIEGAERHFRKGFPSDWMAVRADGTVVIIHEPGDMGTTAYTVEKTTTNKRTIATADAVLWCGEVLKASYDDGILSLQHPHAGRRASFAIDGSRTDVVPVLSRTELIELEGDGDRQAGGLHG